ncbi:magnesium citrate secondary transporter [uncultured Pontibacter sp.]|uniref:magnesium citrate secondary transporter n=1 Tax=uncultured Pontibacter sp. TaxID=453356 RepID=UPI002618180E|nr:magnesium citrate secondary transporter [uncultured Pontibacter sp.]
MRTLQHPLFIISMLLFCLNRVLEYKQLFIWPLHTHLDDLLCLPITLTIVLAAERAYFQNPYFVLPWHYLLIAVLSFSIVFEWLLPMYATRYTSDVWDVVAYAVGAGAFHAFSNQRIMPANAVKSSN